MDLRGLLFGLGGLGACRLIGELDHGQAFGQLQRGLKALGQPLRDIGTHDDAVHHHVDVVRKLLVEHRRFGELMERAVDLDPLKTLLEVFGKLFAVLALAAAHHRRQQVKPGAFVQRQHPVDHLADGLAFDRQAGRRRVGHAGARPEQAHVVVDLGDGRHRRARVLRGGLLLDRNSRRQAVDLIDVRLLHHLQELPGVGREQLHVAALALGVDRIEGERRLAGAGEAGEHHELVTRDLEVDPLEIVLAGTANADRAKPACVGLLAVGLEHFIHRSIPDYAHKQSRART